MSEPKYIGLTAKDAALGIMIGVESVMRENGLILKMPLKETRMLIITEEAIEAAVRTETAKLTSEAEREKVVQLPSQTVGDGTQAGGLSIFARGWNGCLQTIRKLNPNLKAISDCIDVSQEFHRDLSLSDRLSEALSAARAQVATLTAELLLAKKRLEWDGDIATEAARLWQTLAPWEGEDADAQIIIERSLRNVQQVERAENAALRTALEEIIQMAADEGKSKHDILCTALARAGGAGT